MIDSLLDFARSLHSTDGLRHIVQSGGTFALLLIVFAETGLLVGFFLPGDSLLITAGIFAASDGAGGPGLFNIYLLTAILCVAAIVGDQVGFLLGAKAGPMIFKREDSFLFKKKHVLEAHAFYERHGARALIFARFVPIFRTFVPFVAGVAKMEYRSFVRYNVIGGLLWVVSMLWIGYLLGQSEMGKHLHTIIVLVIFVSILPIIFSVAKKLLQKVGKKNEKT